MKASELKEQYNLIKTGFLGIDELFGGGLPTRKIIEVAGSWSVGKSTLAYQIIAAAQKQNRRCLLLDAERAYSTEYGSLMGIDNNELDIVRFANAEEYLDFVFEWLEDKHNKGGLIVIDAIGALLPREEAEKTSESRSIGLQARIIGSFCRKIVPVLDDKDACLLVLNHTFVPLGQMGVASSGGKKLEYARSAWLILSAAYGKPVKRSADGMKTLIPFQIEVKKNKIKSNQGTKIQLELVQGAGFIGETVSAPEPKKRGRPKSNLLS